MVRAGLGRGWTCLFANDIDPMKVEVYAENWGDGSVLERDIHNVRIEDLPRDAALAWASFPCQDLSCAGNGLGIGDAAGDLKTRSGTFWPFVALMKELKAQSRLPRLMVLENVLGLLSTNGGNDFAAVVSAVCGLGFRTGAVVVDARHFVPQSRARVFIIGVAKDVRLDANIVRADPHDVWHPDILARAVDKLPTRIKNQWVWFDLGSAPTSKKSLEKVVTNAPTGVVWHSAAETRRLIDMMSDVHKEKLAAAKRSGKRRVGTLSLRMRPQKGKTVQRAEVSFDGLAGCLRTPRGGGSRLRVVIVKGREVRSRLLSPTEAAQLMGLKGGYKLPPHYNNAFKVIGDGVVVPAVSFLRTRLLTPLLKASRKRKRVRKPQEANAGNPRRRRLAKHDSAEAMRI
ncbi:MAG: (cytosine-5)-methyltransferase 1 [Bradyrhizobium sp.]|jgi:DNA (cytosine-5)-methyltransferase 1|nr:(cytosine-5)-methyltransferase 1 [Bradyrhizobium sp.]